MLLAADFASEVHRLVGQVVWVAAVRVWLAPVASAQRIVQ
jgi:hypothetical protein